MPAAGNGSAAPWSTNSRTAPRSTISSTTNRIVPTASISASTSTTGGARRWRSLAALRAAGAGHQTNGEHRLILPAKDNAVDLLHVLARQGPIRRFHVRGDLLRRRRAGDDARHHRAVQQPAEGEVEQSATARRAERGETL